MLHMCQCGCEKPVEKITNKFIKGHNSKRCHGTIEQRFWRFVNKTENCWLWTGAPCGSYNYGRIGTGPNVIMAHKFSYELHYGKIPDGLQVLHKCDVALCVNPDHLFLGTQKDNMQDAIEKGRHTTQKPDLSFIPRGEKHSRAKLTEADILKIRMSFGNIPTGQIKTKFKISYQQIYMIVKRRYWKHIA